MRTPVLAGALAAAAAMTISVPAAAQSAAPEAGRLAQDSARVVALQQQLLANPQVASVYVELARVYDALGESRRAEETLRQGLGAASDEAPIRGALVSMLAGQKRWNDALEALGPLADQPSGRNVAARLRVNAGVAAFQAGDSTTARADWERALRDQPGLDPAAANLATLLMAIGKPDSAWSVADRALASGADAKLLDPLRAEAAFRTVDAYLAHDDSARARTALARWVGEATDADVLVRAATAADGLDAAALGDRAYRRALKLHARLASLVELAGVRAEAEADSVRALDLYRRAAGMDGGGAIALMGIERLASPPPDSAKQLARRATRVGLRQLEGLEASMVAEARTARSGSAAGMSGAPGSAGSATHTVAAGARRGALLAALRQALDIVVLRAHDGDAELARLRRTYPESALLDRYAARRAVLDGRLAEAADRYDALVHDAPADTTLQRERAALLVRLDRTADAIAGYERVLEMRPEDPNAFHALLRLRGANGSLQALLAQVRRLRVRLPDSPVLLDHEIELLHRLGRPDEAAMLARAKERNP
ncbi:MAG: hypothetical protein P8Z36_04950 [Gemmatimonadota bacterium]